MEGATAAAGWSIGAVPAPGGLLVLAGPDEYSADVYLVSARGATRLTRTPIRQGVSYLTAFGHEAVVALPVNASADHVARLSLTGQLTAISAMPTWTSQAPDLAADGDIAYGRPVPHRVSPKEVTYTFEIHVFNASTGTDTVRVTSDHEVGEPVWGPGGSLAYIDRGNGKGSIITLSSFGGESHLAAPDYPIVRWDTATGLMAVGDVLSPMTTIEDPGSGSVIAHLDGMEPVAWQPGTATPSLLLRDGNRLWLWQRGQALRVVVVSPLLVFGGAWVTA